MFLIVLNIQNARIITTFRLLRLAFSLSVPGGPVTLQWTRKKWSKNCVQRCLCLFVHATVYWPHCASNWGGGNLASKRGSFTPWGPFLFLVFKEFIWPGPGYWDKWRIKISFHITFRNCPGFRLCIYNARPLLHVEASRVPNSFRLKYMLPSVEKIDPTIMLFPIHSPSWNEQNN